MSLRVNYNILNQKGTPAFYSDIFANRPAAGFAGRVFISTDTGAIYEDTGSAWTLIADAGAGTTGTLQQVTTNGNTTSLGLVVTAGNVAIGTATAGAPLDIHCTGTAAQFNGTGTNNAYVFFQNAGTNKWRFGNNYNGNANSLDFFNSGLAAVVASFNANGSLLLNYNLAIKQGTGFNQVSGYSNIAADSGGFFFNTGGANNGYLNFSNLTNSRTFTFPDASGTLALTSDLASYVPTSTTLTINGVTFDLSANRSWTVSGSQWTTIGSNIYYNTGNVGIGTSSPSVKIQTTGGQDGGFKIEPSSSALTLPSTGLSLSTGYNVGYIRNANSSGTTVDLYFEVARVQFGYLGTGLIYSNGGFLTNTNPSDKRLKENINNLKFGLNEILQLRPVSYNWINDTANQGTQYGFIAQEVQEIMPELINKFTTKENQEEVVRLGLDKEAIFVTLVKAIQELNEKLQRNNIN